MDNYLAQHYKGKYRVKAHYDQSTNDFVRDEDGNLEESFGDFYLSGRSGIEIKHGVGSELACYCPKLKLGTNVLRSYYESVIGKVGGKSVDKIVDELHNAGFVNDADIMDWEVYFTFDAKHLDTIAPIIKLKTSGASISPFSNRNLPKAPYTIPKKDMDKYKKARGELKGLQIARSQDEFIESHCGANAKAQMKLEMLKANNWLHKHGYWDEYCKWLKECK